MSGIPMTPRAQIVLQTRSFVMPYLFSSRACLSRTTHSGGCSYIHARPPLDPSWKNHSQVAPHGHSCAAQHHTIYDVRLLFSHFFFAKNPLYLSWIQAVGFPMTHRELSHCFRKILYISWIQVVGFPMTHREQWFCRPSLVMNIFASLVPPTHSDALT